MDDFDFNMKITIVGLGLIGGSLAYSLKKLGFNTIFGIDNNPQVLKLAKSEGLIINENSKNEDILKRSDLVIICLYPSDEIQFIKNHLGDFKKEALITDVSGVKEYIYDAVAEIIPEDLNYVGGHPMAGKEENGFENASGDLLNNSNYLLVNAEDNQKVVAFKKILEGIGCNVVETTPEEHDQMIGLTSQIPHIIASIMTNINTFDNTKAFVGNSFDEMTRISLINEKLWSELFILNHNNLENFLNDIKDEINTFIKVLENKDQQSMEKLLKDTKDKRREYLNS